MVGKVKSEHLQCIFLKKDRNPQGESWGGEDF